MMILRKLIFVASAILIILVVFSFWGFYSAIKPPHKIQSIITPDQLNVPYEAVSFKTKDNILIQGWFIPTTRKDAKTIILLHGYPADKGDILTSRLFLHPEFNLLFFDFRFFGKSEGKYTSFGMNEVNDLKAAVEFLKKRNINEVGVWGLSMGASTALLAAPVIPEIKAIVAESGYARLDKMLLVYYPQPLLQYPLALLTELWGKIFLGVSVSEASPMEAIKKVNIPILIIHSEEDQQVPFEHALWIKESLKHNPHAQFLFTNNLNHGQLSPNEQAKIKLFFEKNLSMNF